MPFIFFFLFFMSSQSSWFDLIERILRSLPRGEVAEMKVGGEVIMTCQFCNVEYRFDEAALERVYAP